MSFAKSGGVLTINLNKDNNDHDATLKFSLTNYNEDSVQSALTGNTFKDVLQLYSGDTQITGANINLNSLYEKLTDENKTYNATYSEGQITFS